MFATYVMLGLATLVIVMLVWNVVAELIQPWEAVPEDGYPAAMVRRTINYWTGIAFDLLILVVIAGWWVELLGRIKP